MRICFVYDAAYPWTKGGVERRIYEIGRRLAVKHDVHVLCVGWWGKESVEVDGVVYHPCCGPIELYSGGRRSISGAIKFAAAVARRMPKIECDVVDCQVFPYLHVAAVYAAKSELVLTWHEVWGDYWKSYLGRLGIIGELVERGIARLGCEHVAVSKTTMRALKKLGVEAATIPNGVDFDTITAVKPAEDGYDVIFSGRLIREKNVDLLLDALAILKKESDVSCLIIGEGPEGERIRRKASQIGADVRGFVEWRDLIALVKSSKVFALPSVREGFGIAALEALACGTPVVTVRHPMNAVTELVSMGCGFAAEPNAGDLAEKIAQAIENGKKLRIRCLEVAKKFDWDSIARATEELYRNFTQGRSRRSPGTPLVSKF